MVMFERLSGNQRWSVVLLGALLCGIVTGGATITQQQATEYHLLQFSVPFGLSLVVATFGGWLVRSDLSADQVSRIALWSLGGVIVVGSFALWEMVLHTLEGETVVEALHEPLLGMAEGAAVGSLIGYYDSRRIEQLQETQEAHEAISASVDGIAVLDEDERYTTVNQAHAEVYGYDDPDEFIGESWRMCYSDTELEQIEDEVFQVLGEAGDWRGELTGVRRNGETFPQEVSLSMMEDGGLVCVVRDISDQKRRTRELEAAQGRFQALTENAGFGVVTIDEDSTIRYANDALEDVLGYAPEDVVGEPLTTLMPDRFRDSHLSGIQRYLNEGDKTLDWEWLELPGQHSDGHEVPLGISFGETILEDGHLFTGILRDITAQVEQEEQIAALHDASRRLTEATTPDEVASVTVDIANDVLGEPFSTMLFYDEEDDQLNIAARADSTAAFLKKVDVGELSGISTGQLGMEIFRSGEMRVIDDYETVDNRAFPDLPLGTVVIVPVGGYGILALGGQSIEAVTETERHQIELLALNARAALERAEREQTLAEREQRLRTILENMPIILFAVSQDRKITLQVGKGLEQVNIEQNQMIGTPVEEVFPDSPAVLDAIERSLDGESVDITVDIWGRTYQVWYEPIWDAGEVTNAIGVAMDVTDRDKRERGIRALHDVTRDMMQETDTKTICQMAVDTAQNALGLPICTIWMQSDDQPRLDPVAWSNQAEELFGELPTFEPGGSLAWQAFADGTPRVFDDVRHEADRYNPDTEMRSELIVPIGDYGVLNSGSTDVGRFEETDVVLAQLLAANTRSALERAEREATLQRQTDEMEFFNSILRHDVLNGMTVIRGRAEFLTDDLEGQQLQDAETIVDWSNDIVTIIQRVRTVLETLTGTEDPHLEPTDLSGALRAEISRVQTTYPDVTFETVIPDGVTVQTNELLGEVLGNVITNAVDHNDRDGLRIVITVDDPTETDDHVTVRIADNGRGVPDDSKEAIFRREETGHAKSTGSGFGLFFVDSMVAKYGGDIRVVDTDTGGAEFVIELPTP